MVGRFTRLGVLPVDQLHMRAVPAIDELASMIRGAEQEVVGEIFKLTNPGPIGAIAERASHVTATFLMDAQVHAMPTFARTRGRFADSGAVVNLFGEIRSHKLHTKGFVTDAERGWLSTAAIMRHGEMLDFTATFTGEPAKALRRLTLTTIDGGRWAQRRAADAAARHGILLNDRAVGVSHLRRGWDQAIDSAERELVVSSKAFTDARLAARLVQRSQEGVDVYIATQSEKMSKRVRKILAAGGVPWVDDTSKQLHGNAAVADGRLAVFGSAHMSERAMVRSSAWVRNSRELGAMVDGEDALRLRDEIRSFTEHMARVP